MKSILFSTFAVLFGIAAAAPEPQETGDPDPGANWSGEVQCTSDIWNERAPLTPADCLEAFRPYMDNPDDLVPKQPPYEWQSISCVDGCRVSFYQEDDTQWTNMDVLKAISVMINECAGGDNNGQVSGTTGVGPGGVDAKAGIELIAKSPENCDVF